MPELPELQVYSRNLNKSLIGKTVVNLSVYNRSVVNASPAQLRTYFVGATILFVKREGKLLIFEFDSGHTLGFHLMQHGLLKVTGGEPDIQHPIIKIEFEEEIVFTLEDWQQAAHILLDAPIPAVPDALSESLDVVYLKGCLEQNGKNIKTILLDQNIIRGIGSAYADEILWTARISPYSVGKKIPIAQLKKLVRSIKSVFTFAERTIWKRHPGMISGDVRDHLLIHNPGNKESPDGYVIHSVILASRKTYYTDEQEEYM